MPEGSSLNIALVPDDDTTTAAIAMSEAMSDSVGAEFILTRQDRIPHITLYQTAFPVNALPMVYAAVEYVAKRTAAFSVRLREIETYKWTFVFWQCELSSELRSAHEHIVATTNELRAGLVLPMLTAARPFLDSSEQADVDSYGAVWIGPNFLPHITLSRITNVQDVSAALHAVRTPAPRTFVPKAIVVGESKDHGTIGRVLQRYDLRQH